MSVTGRASIGIPIVLLYEGEGYTITVESKSGELYRGLLTKTEENMNLYMGNVSFTDREGNVRKLEQVYIRGATIRFIIFPDILSKSPMFKRVVKHKETKGRYKPQGSGTERPGRQGPGGGRKF